MTSGARYQAKYRKRRHLNGGRPLTMPSELAAARLRHLRAAGMGTRRIAEASGVNRRSLLRILKGETKRIALETHERIMRVEPDSWLVDATPTHRRVQALVAMGYSMAKLEAIRGKPRTIFYLLQSEKVFPRVAMEWAELYEQLSMTPPPAETRYDRMTISRAKNLAAKNGWAPPLAWDDIDNLDERPKHKLSWNQRRRDEAKLLRQAS